MLAAIFVGACSAPVVAPTAASGEVIAFGGGPGGVADACFTCHGLKGEGDELAPKLAGQTRGYLLKQMQNYAAHGRKHPQMTAISARLDDAGKLAVAEYYARMPSHPPRPQATMGAWPLFLDGDAARGIQPCAKCHGAQGQGGGLANPSLAGQPGAYVSAQLRAWKASERRNDPEDVMGAIARQLSEAEIDALAAHVAAMSP